MNHYTILGSHLKRGILRFSEKISGGLTRPNFKLVSQFLYGLLASQSCQLSNIARALNENIKLKKTIYRVSRNLATFDCADRLFENYFSAVKESLSGNIILIVDNGDIIKPCSEKMEYIGKVRDGSTGEYGEGYHTLVVTALTPEKKQPIGVYTRVYSASEPEFVSEDDEILKALRFLGTHFNKDNIRAFDRGYDANVYYEDLMDNNERFIIRAKKNRNVIYNGKTLNILELAKRYKGKYRLKFKKKNGEVVDCKISIVPIRLCSRSEVELNLVICNGLGTIPLMLITNMKSTDDRLSVVLTKVYLLRWRIEEFYRFKKQQFGFENFRVRSMQSIRNLDLLLTIAIGYIGIMSEKVDERGACMELIELSKRIYGLPKFLFYAIADGFAMLFAKCKRGLGDMLRKRPKARQLTLMPEAGFGWA